MYECETTTKHGTDARNVSRVFFKMSETNHFIKTKRTTNKNETRKV